MQQIVTPLDQDIWTTNIFSYAPGGGGPGGGLADELLKVGGWGDVYYSLLKFNLTGLPLVATHVELRLFDLNSGGGTPTGLNLYQITQDWNWQTGGTGSDHDRLWWADQPSAVIDPIDPNTLPAPTVGTYYNIDITYLYNAWQGGTLSNYGLEIRPTSNNNNFDIFASSRNANSDLRPALIITTPETTREIALPFSKQFGSVLVTQEFGEGVSNRAGGNDHGAIDPKFPADEYLYYAIDFGLRVGTPVQAHGQGVIIDSRITVERATNGPSDHFGNYVTVQYDDGAGGYYYATYMHLDKSYVAAVGTSVVPGQLIAFSGDTGTIDAQGKSHQHLHVTYGNEKVLYHSEVTMADGSLAANPNGPPIAFQQYGMLRDGHFVIGNNIGLSVSEGYLSGATVYVDANGNDQLDSDEASGITDAGGYFVPFGILGPVVAFSGIDTSTGLNFKGQLSAPAGSSVITPLTTLVALLSSDRQAERKVLSSFGLSSSIDLNTFDPIAAAKAGSADGVATTAAVAKVYDTVSLIASTLVAAGGDFSSGVKDAFSAIASAIGGAGVSLTNQAQISALVTAAAQADGLTLAAGVADSVASIIVATNTLLDQKAQSGATGDALLDAIAAIERVVQGTASNAVQQAGNDPSQLQALANAFSGANLDAGVSTALGHLGTADTTAPVLTPVADQTSEATSASGATAVFAATAADNLDGAVPVVFKEGNTVVHSGDVFSLGSHTITASTIDAAGNVASETFKVNVVDTTAPTLAPVANRTKEATSAAGAAAFFTASATDAVDGTDVVVFKDGNAIVHSGDTFGLGNHTITASTIDAAGNLASETFSINVRDTTAPTLTPIADQKIQATTAAGAAAFFTTTASDLVDGSDPVTYTEKNKVVHSGDIFGVGVHSITATAVDAAGNFATDLFEINVMGVASNNHNPIAIDDSMAVAKGKSLSVSTNKGVLANDSDVDHDHLSVGSVNGSAANVGHAIKGDYGTLTLNVDGSYSYAATAKALPSQIFAQDTFTYTNVDGHGGSDTATLTFSVYDPSFNYQAGSNTILWGGSGKNVLDGSAGQDLMYGGNGADVLIGGKGDVMLGGKGADQFVFRADFGPNTILDFNVKNDRLQFDDTTFGSIKNILDHTTNTALGALISDGHGDSVLLVGVNKAQLLAHSSDLLIS